ncbi:MAG: myo-inosose-2 dehydratase [Aestuariivirga sp.]|uniref:myo-inosose-2 dehydratase n=1 Tax=Aestuariivirga sp. TaxID=2650926 RepID=UPI0025BB3787|nr:myo-inosose-2 dehydratase [Aestuariivirga sp.]MCA3561871.1 myo-inosose-2 dehydratase [Aestuariivirga sp.]
MKAKLGMSPIAWWNDDLPELSDDVSLEECLRQSRSAGFTGMEQGRRFPATAAEMLPALKKADVTLCGGWYSATLVNESLDVNKKRIQPMIDLFKAVNAPCIVYGEVGLSIQGDQSRPLASKAKLSADEMKAYGAKVSEFAKWVEAQGMPIVYHHHMGAVVETEPELDAFMAASGIALLFDAGHMAFAGGDVLRCIDKHHKRIRHVHTKDVRMEVIEKLDRTKDSFLDAVIKGAFTVPGDGSLDFEAIVKKLASYGYQGWFVVEAEQDPKKAPPLKMAQVGHAELMRVMTAAGYEVVA